VRRAVERGQLVPSTAARFTRRLPAPAPRTAWRAAEKCISQRLGNLWRTDNGARRSRQSYALRSPSLTTARSSFSPSHVPISIISILCLGKRVAQCVATSQFSERDRPVCPAGRGRIYRSQLTAIIPDESFEVNALLFKLPIFSDSCNPFNVIFLLRRSECAEIFVSETKEPLAHVRISLLHTQISGISAY